MKPVISAHLHAGHTSSSKRLLHRFPAIFQSGSVRLAEIPSQSSSEPHLLVEDVVTGHSGDVSVCAPQDLNHTIPSRTLPNTTCFPSSHGALAKVMKNCEPLVSGPAFAMLTQPAPRCFSLKFSSANVLP